jgi:hypothetical protein
MIVLIRLAKKIVNNNTRKVDIINLLRSFNLMLTFLIKDYCVFYEGSLYLIVDKASIKFRPVFYLEDKSPLFKRLSYMILFYFFCCQESSISFNLSQLIF